MPVPLLQFNGIGADPAQLRHRFGTHSIGIAERLRCGKEFGLEDRTSRTGWDRLATTPLPGIAVLSDGSLLLPSMAHGED